jgi:CheY-like chemotaxis protein
VLAPILLSIEMLAMDETDQNKRDILGTIESSARRGAEMVKQVLAFARGSESARLPVSISDVVQSMAQIVRDTFPKSVTLKTDVAAELPPLVGDATQIEQVLLNLCVNARDAMPYGGDLRITVTWTEVDTQFVGPTRDAKTGPHVVIDVEDTGTGMTADVVERIFDPFFTTKAPGHGTGLGLSSSIAIVKGHGGFMHVYSEPGKGSRFRVYLPASEAGAAARTRRPTPVPAESLRGQGELILLVEDEEQVRTITRKTLETYGYQVVTASDGADAVAVFAMRRHEIALVVTDLMMPVMDGQSMIDVMVRMMPTVRIIAVSGLQDNARRLPAAVRQFLAKPFNAATLLEAVRGAMDA